MNQYTTRARHSPSARSVRCAARREGGRSRDPRREPRPGYAETQLKPKRRPPKAPGEGGPFEPQNDPRQKPGRQNG